MESIEIPGAVKDRPVIDLFEEPERKRRPFAVLFVVAILVVAAIGTAYYFCGNILPKKQSQHEPALVEKQADLENQADLEPTAPQPKPGQLLMNAARTLSSQFNRENLEIYEQMYSKFQFTETTNAEQVIAQKAKSDYLREVHRYWSSIVTDVQRRHAAYVLERMQIWDEQHAWFLDYLERTAQGPYVSEWVVKMRKEREQVDTILKNF